MLDSHMPPFATIDPLTCFDMCPHTHFPNPICQHMLTCHMPPGLPLPRTTWSTLPSSTCLHSSKLGNSSPRSASGFCRASSSNETGLFDLPSSPWMDEKCTDVWRLNRGKFKTKTHIRKKLKVLLYKGKVRLE